MNTQNIKDYLRTLTKDTYNSSIFLLILLGVIVSFLVSSLYFSSQIYAGLERIILSLLLIIAFCILLVKYIYSINISDKSWLTILLVLIGSSVLARLIFAFSFEQEYYSDFRTMWNYACRVGSEGVWIPPDRPQTERPLPIFVPLTYLFGCGEWVFKCFNVFALTVQNTLIALIIKKIVSSPASILAFLLLSLQPESYFASLIPTHDIPGSLLLVLYISLFFLIFSSNFKISTGNLIGLAFILGIVGLLLHIQRGIFLPLWLTTAIFSAFMLFRMPWCDQQKRLLFAMTICVITPILFVMTSTKVLTVHSILYDKDNPASIYSVWGEYGFRHSMVDGSFSNARHFYDNYAKGNDYTDNRYYSRAFFFTDLYRDWQKRPMNWLERIKRVTKFSTQGGFYYGRLQGIDEAELKRLRQSFSGINVIFNFFFTYLVLGTTLALLISKKVRKNVHPFIFFPIIFVGLGIFAIGLIGETQPRYLFFVPALMAIPVFAILDAIFKPSMTSLNNDMLNLRMKGLVSLCICIVLAFIFFRTYIEKSPYLLADMSKPMIECAGISEDKCPKARIFTDAQRDVRVHSNLTLQHPVTLNKGDAIRAIYKLQPIDPGEQKLVSLYVQTPYKRGDGRTGFFDKNIYANGVLRKTLHLSDTDAFQLVKFEVKGNGEPLEIILESVSNVDYKAASWIRASTVNFRFLAIR